MSYYSEKLQSIIFSKSFRRMKSKTQLITDSYNDNCRTRISHTTEVVNIAQNIANHKGRKKLAEIIAYSHDIGHTPFGHAGERALHRIITGQNPHFFKLNRALKHNPEFMGYKHNLHGALVVTKYEQLLDTSNSKDLEIIRGIVYHTGLDYGKDGELGYYKDILEKVNEGNQSVEELIVSVSDEIAQIVENIEDGLDLQLIDLDRVVGVIDQSLYAVNLPKKLSDSFNKINVEVLKKSNTNHNLRSLTKVLIQIFEWSVIESLKNNSSDFFENDLKTLFKELNRMFKERIIKSNLVRGMDLRAENIITETFDLFYSSPEILPDTVKNRILISLNNSIELEQNRYLDFEAVLTDYKKHVNYDRCFQTKTDLQNLSTIQDIDTIMKDKIIVVISREIINYLAEMTDTFIINTLRRADSES